MPDYADEAVLVAGLKSGEASAFEYLVRTQSPRLLAMARRILANEEDAQDALQEGFLSAFKALERFDSRAKFSTWLHRIVMNAALMRLRSRRTRGERSIEPLIPVFDDRGLTISPGSGWNEDAISIIQERERHAMVRELIDELPDAYRAVLVLRDVEGLDTEETGVHLGITPNAVKTRLHRARQALKTLIERRLAASGGARGAGGGAP